MNKYILFFVFVLALIVADAAILTAFVFLIVTLFWE